jgi:hypothetical protein
VLNEREVQVAKVVVLERQVGVMGNQLDASNKQLEACQRKVQQGRVCVYVWAIVAMCCEACVCTRRTRACAHTLVCRRRGSQSACPRAWPPVIQIDETLF